MAIVLSELLPSLVVGLVGGLTSGLLGVSPGGGLVVFSVLLLGAEQHAAQGISLFAQIAPTSLAGVRRYREKGNRSPLRWLVFLALGFLAGGVAGALAAGSVSTTTLQWTYVGYLGLLTALLIFRPPSASPAAPAEFPNRAIHWAPLLGVGAIAGFSSGFLGIGGGLAITAGLAAGLKVPQHQAQLVSLVLTVIPTTIPAAYIYWRQGWSFSWIVIGAVIVGLYCGNDLGSRLANRLSGVRLSRVLIGFVLSMAGYMAYKALSGP